MTAMVSMNTKAFSCSTAAAGFSASIVPILDTADALAVSICVLPLRVRRAGT